MKWDQVHLQWHDSNQKTWSLTVVISPLSPLFSIKRATPLGAGKDIIAEVIEILL